MSPESSRYVVGIDLGTTNSAASFADLAAAESGEPPQVHRFRIPQIVRPGEVEAADTLPSFLYLAPPEEREADRLHVPWSADGAPVVGIWARDRGALLPGRLVSSAKSWLSHDAVDRRAKILPWSADPAARHVSPLDASATYLRHVRDAWNHLHADTAGARLEDQEVVLTVPASFDEEARELTIEAAGAAGFERLTLIEEPAAALYAWIAAHPGEVTRHLSDGDRVLVCDVGGGTTDFTLVEVRIRDGEPIFERVRVGEHLLLGGDNVDLALARLVEEKLGGPRLSLTQQQALVRQCAAVKERLLGPPGTAKAEVTVLGTGRALVGGTLSTTLTRDEVLERVLDGFLPFVPRDDAPAADRRAGLRELALPYAADPAITRHLAAFLRTDDEMTRPDVVLFNGGFFTPDETRARVTDVVASWFADADAGWRPRVLANRSPATAVADGAAYFGLVRHGHGIRIGGGSARAYYIGLRQEDDRSIRTDAAEVQAVCILPRGTHEGTTLDLTSRSFTVRTNQVLAFTLYSSRTREDSAGDVIAVPASALHRHAPLVTELRYGKRSRSVEIPVQVEARYTELGTLALSLLAKETTHRWRLEFQLRQPVRVEGDAAVGGGHDALGTVPREALDRATALIKEVFTANSPSPATPATLMAELETILGSGRHGWPLGVIRILCDALLDVPDGRQISARHEARYLNLLGFCLRPGFGSARDGARVAAARRIYLAGLAFPSDIQCGSEWLVLWQRIAPGLTATQQLDLFNRYAATLGLRGRAAKRLHPQIERETWRLLASLEQIDPAMRAMLGDAIVARLRKDRHNTSLLWALGRVGARVPFHGPLNTVVPPAHAEAWLRALLARPDLGDEVAVTIVQVAAMTGDPARDVPEELRRETAERLAAAGHPERLVSRLLEPAAAERTEVERVYGESLPEGLRLGDV